VEVLVTLFVLGTFAFLFFKAFTDPEWLPRLGARLVSLPFSKSERKSLTKIFPRIDYFYDGTTGDKEKDAHIRRSQRNLSRAWVILILSGFLFTLVVSTLIASLR